jgi:SAM-dependent methyltransferase
MSEPTLQILTEAANQYEALYGPISAQYAAKAADIAQIQNGQRVLDVACGTGILTREVASRSGSNGYVVGIDPNPGMLAVARQLAPAIEWHQGSAESLPFPDQSFDLVVSNFGLMFFTDRQRAIREMLRVLVPGGHLTVTVWDALKNVPAYALEVELLERHGRKDAADAVRAPFVLGDRLELTTLFESAGADSVNVTTYRGTGRFQSIRVMVEAELRGWLPLEGIVLPEELIVRILEEAEHVLSPYVNEQGNVVFEWPAHIVTATKQERS